MCFFKKHMVANQAGLPHRQKKYQLTRRPYRVHFKHFARSRAWRLGHKGATTAPSNGQRFFFFFPRLHGAWLKL